MSVIALAVHISSQARRSVSVLMADARAVLADVDGMGTRPNYPVPDDPCSPLRRTDAAQRQLRHGLHHQRHLLHQRYVGVQAEGFAVAEGKVLQRVVAVEDRILAEVE